MRKTFFVLLFLLSVTVYSQEAVFSYGQNGGVVPSSANVEAFEYEDFQNITPYLQRRQTVISADQKYTVYQRKYNNCDNNPGDYHVIEVMNERGDLLYSLRNDDGWVWLDETWGNAEGAPFYMERLDDRHVILFFTGVTIMSQPPYFTALVIGDNQCRMVLNKPMCLNDIQLDGGLFIKFQRETTEYIDFGVQYNFPKEFTLFVKDGMLYIK
ncbi:MAG: hypothetical protein NC116_00740 [Clostridium sp.]|nr:hypothetical protein [Clostridium sp.]